MYIHLFPPLWKTPVEKYVENVEKYEFSTGICVLSILPSGCGKLCIYSCIPGEKTGCILCYVNVPFWTFLVKNS